MLGSVAVNEAQILVYADQACLEVKWRFACPPSQSQPALPGARDVCKCGVSKVSAAPFEAKKHSTWEVKSFAALVPIVQTPGSDPIGL